MVDITSVELRVFSSANHSDITVPVNEGLTEFDRNYFRIRSQIAQQTGERGTYVSSRTFAYTLLGALATGYLIRGNERTIETALRNTASRINQLPRYPVQVNSTSYNIPSSYLVWGGIATVATAVAYKTYPYLLEPVIGGVTPIFSRAFTLVSNTTSKIINYFNPPAQPQ